MKNRRKQGKIFRSLLAVLMLTAMLVTSVLQPVFAGDYVAGKTGNLTLTVQQADEEGTQTPLKDVGLTIYKVGSVNFDGNVHFVLDEALAAAAINFDSITTADGWYDAAEKLAAMIVSGSVDVWGMSKSSDAEGNMTFAKLDEGMYLVVQTDGNSSVMVSPMLISVPFADQEQGWIYDVQAYPKSVSNPQKHTQIQVTKRIYNVDENDNVIPLETKEDVTYNVGLYLDPDGEARYGEMQKIHIQNASSGTATWTDVPDGTYYVFELDEDGTPLQQNTKIKVDDENLYYYNVTKPNGESEEKSNQVVIGGDSGATEAAAYVNNYYTKISDIFSRNGFINIKKNVMIDGVASTVDDTFYAGVFSTESNGELTLEKVVTLKQNDSVQVMLDLPKDQEINSVTYTVLETDKDGNPVDHDSFAYEIDGEGDIILNESESYENSMDITNSKNTTPEPTVTNTPVPSGQPTVTPSERTSTPVPGGSTSTNNDGGGTTGRTSVKTGDNTPIGVWVGILAAAIVVGGAAGFAVKRKKKK
jgi:LPXTG-motif cell wall-anchored protein